MRPSFERTVSDVNGKKYGKSMGSIGKVRQIREKYGNRTGKVQDEYGTSVGKVQEKHRAQPNFKKNVNSFYRNSVRMIGANITVQRNETLPKHE